MKKYVYLALALLLGAGPLAACAREKEPNLSEVPEAETRVPSTGADPALPETDDRGAIAPPESETPPVPSEREEPRAEYGIVSADALRLRAGAGTEYPVLGTAQRGEVFPILGRSGEWAKTAYRGKTAYLSESYLTPLALGKGTNEAEAVVSEGYALLGTPYVYGAVRYHDGSGARLKNFTAEAFDCSSLMQYIFYRGAGINLDLTTRTQIKQGTHVREEDLQRGDLLFFTNAARAQKTGIERVGHVALYLGGGYILHTASDYAKIERISPLRQSYFLEARRVLP